MAAFLPFQTANKCTFSGLAQVLLMPLTQTAVMLRQS